MPLSTGRILSEIQQHTDTREMWIGMDREQKQAVLDRIGDCDDYKCLQRSLRRITNKSKHKAAEIRRQELNRRLQEIKAHKPQDSTLADIRIEILNIFTGEPSPMLRAAKLYRLVAKYYRRKSQLV